MALLDFLKRKKEVEKAKDTMPVSRQVKKIDKPTKISAVSAKSKKTVAFSYDIIKEPHISEKATMLSESNQYIFKVYSNTNKIDIKKAVAGVYGVDVLSVNIIKIPKKKRRLGKVQGFKSGYVKAIVKIKDGQKIEIL
ncbi:MAG: 50S ribosomal protein L23 [Patescibacteria group bacterium]